MFTDVDVAAVIRSINREGRPGHSYVAATAAGMPSDVYTDAVHYAQRAHLIKVLGQLIVTTHKGNAYARRVARSARATAEIARWERRNDRPDHAAATSDDFDGPLARSPGGSSAESGVDEWIGQEG
jgi:hypothetical protein